MGTRDVIVVAYIFHRNSAIFNIASLNPGWVCVFVRECHVLIAYFPSMANTIDTAFHTICSPSGSASSPTRRKMRREAKEKQKAICYRLHMINWHHYISYVKYRVHLQHFTCLMDGRTHNHSPTNRLHARTFIRPSLRHKEENCERMKNLSSGSSNDVAQRCREQHCVCARCIGLGRRLAYAQYVTRSHFDGRTDSPLCVDKMKIQFGIK